MSDETDCQGTPDRAWKRTSLSTRPGAPWWITLAALLVFVLAGCDQISIPRLIVPATATPQPAAIFATPSPQPQASPTAQPTLEAVPRLTLWVPPAFEPSADTEAGRLLQARLDEFARKEGVKVEVRIKAPSGPGGLLESLSAASAAAPGAVPALIALSRPDLETAALKGLVSPIDVNTQAMQGTDWFPYARQLAQIQGTTFGLPFGGDALLLVYRPARMGPPPADWNAIFKLAQPVVLPAADPQGMVTLNLYRMLGGQVEDEQNRPVLQEDVLAKALKLYSDGIQPGVFPYWLSQIETDPQAWQAYRDQRGQWLITWSSLYLAELPPDSAAVALPSLGEKPLSLASGWVWALSDPVPERRALSARLAEFLTEPEFLSSWTYALGLIPPRPSALANWSNASLRSVINQVSLSAEVRPSNDLMASLGPALQSAALQVIKREAEPAKAAQAAAERLSIPKPK